MPRKPAKKTKYGEGEHAPVTLDATGIARVSVNLILEQGSPSEIKRLIRHMSDAIRSTSIPMLHDVEREWLAKALMRISNGMNANIALQLKTQSGIARRTGVMKAMYLLHQVESLTAQGVTETRALSVIASHNVAEAEYERLLMHEDRSEDEARLRASALKANDVVGDRTIEEMTHTEVERLKKQLRLAKRKFKADQGKEKKK